MLWSRKSSQIEKLYPFSARMFVDGTMSTTGGVPIVICITGGSAALYEYEVVEHVEYIGEKTTSNSTESFADSSGVNMVQNIVNKTNADRTNGYRQPVDTALGLGQSLFDSMGNAMSKTAESDGFKYLMKLAVEQGTKYALSSGGRVASNLLR